MSRRAQSLINQATGNPLDLETMSLKQHRQSARLKDQKHKNHLIDAISIQSETNTMIERELKYHSPQLTRCQQIRTELKASLRHIHDLYDKFRVSLSGENDKQITTMIDKLTHDNKHLCELAKQAMCLPSISHESSTSHKPSTSHKSAASHRSSNKSAVSIRSSSSGKSQLRLMQAQSAARAAELEAQLHAESETSKIEAQLAQLESAKRAAQLKGQIEAEKVKSAIFAQALSDEQDDRSELLLPTSKANQLYQQSQLIHDHSTSASQHEPLTACATHNNNTNNLSHNIDQAICIDDDNDDDECISLAESFQDSEISIDRETVNEPLNNTMKPHEHAIVYTHNDKPIKQITNDLAEAITTAFNMNRLPPPEPFIFDGNPMSYPDWSFAFDNLVGNKQCSVVEKLHYLKRYVSGKALETVEGYFLLQNQDAYHKAREALNKRFGNPFIVAEAFRHKIDQWPVIKPRDYDGLRKFSDFLNQCKTAQGTIEQLSILNDNRENKKMLAKLPEYITRKWVRYATTYSKAHGTFPKFAIFCKFMGKETEVLCNPLFQDLGGNKPNHTPENVKKQERKTYATKHDQSLSAKQTNMHVSQQPTKLCVYCNMTNHATAECRVINRLPILEQRQLLRSKHLCFACLNGNHSYRQCEKPAKCKICQGSHPSALHNLRTQASSENTKPKSTSDNRHEQPANVSQHNSKPTQQQTSSQQEDEDSKPQSNSASNNQ